ncbi:MAG: histidine--tRNA ligase [Bacilli bacterium]|nr:histidine--tRNA ligase [Bacilli bacterium]
MKKIDTSNLKGVTDYLGEEQKVRNNIINILRNTFENYGFVPLDSSILYNYDILAYKYTEDAEILKEIYTLRDQGDRKLALRYDLTIPFCKVIANKKDLRLPLRRYEIGKVFRNGPVKLGRCREFYQCDIDVVGIDGTDIEVEQMMLVCNVFDKLGINIVIKWNNRKLMSSLINYVGIPLDKVELAIGIIDKLEKISKDEIVKEFDNIGISNDIVDKLFDLFSRDINYYNTLDIQNELFTEGLREVNEISNKLTKLGIISKTKFTPSLARGLSIYTGTVFEFFDVEKRLTCSLGGGGRYNKIITEFIDDGEVYPAVGLSFGLEPIYTIIKDKFSSNSLTDIYIIPMGTETECIKLAESLRKINKNVLIEFNKRKLKRCFEYADKEKIKYVIVVGEDEINNNTYTMKNMETGEQFKLNEKELVDYFNN